MLGGVSRVPPARALVLLASAVFAGLILHLGLGGSVWIAPQDVVRELVSPGGGVNETIIWNIRLPRGLGCILVGSLLGAVGAAFQAFFRNPLAEPYVVGVSSGAGLGGTVAIIAGWGSALAGTATMLAGAVGGGLTLLLVLALGQRRGSRDVVRLVLAGVVVGTMVGGLMTAALMMAGKDTTQVLRWLLGSTTPMFWPRLTVLSAVALVGIVVLMTQSRTLTVYQFDSMLAERLGADHRRVTWIVLGTGTLMVAAAVGAVGIIGFVGLAGPHIARLLMGPDSRRTIPGGALAGAVMLLFADVVSQRLMPGVELPVGAVTAVLGAPLLLFLLRRDGQSVP